LTKTTWDRIKTKEGDYNQGFVLAR